MKSLSSFRVKRFKLKVKRKTAKHQPYWVVYDNKKYGRCFGYPLSAEDKVVRLLWRFKNKPRCKGRQSFYHQPIRFIRVGWYFEFMKEEWGVVTGKSRRDWLIYLIRRQERSV